MADLHDIDQSLFWHLVNKQKRRSNRSHPIKLSSGDIVSDPDELCKEWAKYFQTLYTPVDKAHYDQQFQTNVENELEEMILNSYDVSSDVGLFKPDELVTIYKKMNDKKAPGFDNICVEHFKHGGPKCLQVVTHIFNCICQGEKVPYQFKRGVLIPIPKGDKDRSLQDSYRGITLLQTMRKIFEKALLEKKVSKWVKDGHIIDDLQGAAQEHCSSLETNWIVRETTNHYLENQSLMYVCMLDVKKAFDSVWQKALFYKLCKVGMDPKIWRILIDMYSEPECCIKVEGRLSGWIKALQGIIQGGPLSMFNYQIINNDLIQQLKSCNAGTVIGPHTTTSPAFADDLTILAPTRSALQKLLNLAYRHSCQWRYDYNVEKSAIIVYGCKETVDQVFSMGNARIKVVSTHEHVGTILSPSKKGVIDYIKMRVDACNKPGYAIMSLGSKSAPMTPKSASTLYWSVCVPKLTYGCEVMNIPCEAMTIAESFHAKMAKVIQGLPDQASNVGAVASMGWLSISGYVDMLILLYFMRIIMLPTKSIYKKIFIHQYCSHMYTRARQLYGPVGNFLNIAKRYELLDVVKMAVENSLLPSKNHWKNVVKSKVWEAENKQWKIRSTMYKTLQRIRVGMPNLEMLAWWHYVQINPSETWKCRTVLRLLLDCNDLRECQFRYHKEGVLDPYCHHCDERNIEDVTHVLFECSESSTVRLELWNTVLACCPASLIPQLQQLSAIEKTTFVLTAFNNSFVTEWMSLYKAIVSYIHKIYTARLALK
jgi:hypothetical protein